MRTTDMLHFGAKFRVVAAALALGILRCAGIDAPQQDDVLREIIIRAHRGGGAEAPENTLAAFRQAWACANTIPEVDIHTTKDGVLIALHDETLARPTDAPESVRSVPVSRLSFAEVRKWDAGVKFDERFKGERVPSLEEVLALMAEDPARELYLDVKAAEYRQLMEFIADRGLINRTIWGGLNHQMRQRAQEMDGIRTFASVGGTASDIQEGFERAGATGFEGISHLQLHLKTAETSPTIVYALDAAFLRRAAEQTRAAGVVLQIRPFRYNSASLGWLIDQGVRCFETNEPRHFIHCLHESQNK